MNGNLYLIAHQFNPVYLKLAREFRGMQKNELASQVDLTPSAVTQLENGEIKPQPQTVARLSLALRFPPSFFSQNDDCIIVSPDECHFRGLRSCTQIEYRKVVTGSSLIGKIVNLVDQQVELPKEQITENMFTNINTEEDIEFAAMQVRKAWGLGLGPIDNVIYLLESKGVLVFRLLNDSKKVDAFSHRHNKRPFVFLNTEKGCSTRSRYDACHELGHLIMHPDYLPGDRNQERQADFFAGAFLLPKEVFLRECPKRLVWQHFLELKQRWKVSLAALVRRAKDLGLLSQDTYRRANIYLNKEWKRQEPFEPALEQPTILPQAIKLLEQNDWSLPKIAEHLHLSYVDLINLVYADNITDEFTEH